MFFLRKIVSNKRANFSEDDYINNSYDNTFISEALFWHNIYRKHHRTPPLKISPQVMNANDQKEKSYIIRQHLVTLEDKDNNVESAAQKVNYIMDVIEAHERGDKYLVTEELCNKAQCWANQLAHTNTFLYNTDKSVGQNIFCRLSNDDDTTDVTGQEIVSHWYSAFKNYMYSRDIDTLHININAGSFTQLIWKSTKFVGIGRARSRSGKILVVAHYEPAGNICGQFQQNVLPHV